LLNLRLGLEDTGGKWTLTGSVTNATNKSYNAEFVLGGFAQPAPGREYLVEARYNFLSRDNAYSCSDRVGGTYTDLVYYTIDSEHRAVRKCPHRQGGYDAASLRERGDGGAT